MLQSWKTCLLLVTFLLGFTFPAWPEAYPHERPQVIVSVYDDAGVSAHCVGRSGTESSQDFRRSRSRCRLEELSNIPNPRRPGRPRPGGRAKLARFFGRRRAKGAWSRNSQILPGFARPGGWGHPPLRGPSSTVPASSGQPTSRCELCPGLRAQPVKSSGWPSCRTKAPAATAMSSMTARWNCTPIGTSAFRTFWEM